MKKLLCLILCFTLLLSLAACSEKDSNTDLPPITVVLDWTPNTNHTGLYVAQQQGYFAAAGLDVRIVQPPEDGAEVLVASGKAQFGVSFQDYLAPALIGAEPLPITAVAALIQHNSSGIISRAGEGISSPKGLEGKRYATWDLPVEKATIAAVMAAEGSDFSQVILLPSTVTDEVSALQSGSVDAIWVFYAWGGIACETANLPTDYFAFADISPEFDYYSPVLIANNSFLAEQPDTAKAFLSALQQGYEYAIAHPQEAADMLLTATPELKSNSDLVYASQQYLASRYVDDAPRWGEIDAERWAAFYRWLNENQLLEEELNPYDGFSNDYLPN